MNSQIPLDDACVTCGDTGHWSGEPNPCPECGAFIPRPRPEAKSFRYVEKHSGPNRHERRASLAKKRQSNS